VQQHQQQRARRDDAIRIHSSQRWRATTD
jgi:hypothetical protein